MALPTRLKIDIRDNFSKETVAFQKASKSLSDVVGLPLVCEPDWHMLWDYLFSYFNQMSTFIPTVSRILKEWCTSMMAILKDENNVAWAERVRAELSKTDSLKLRLGVRGTDRPTTRWTAAERAFIIYLPKCRPISSETVSAGFNTDLLHCFEPEPPQAVSPSLGPQVANQLWENVEVGEMSAFPAPHEGQTTPFNPAISSENTSDVLPDCDELEAPEYLMLRPPYHMIISHNPFQREMLVQCSHLPTLQVIEGYLKRWTKVNYTDIQQPPAAILTFQESPFGLGVVHDRLHISMQHSRSHFMLSPTMLISFVESILGYNLIFGSSDTWTFRREKAFKEK